jgi:cytochrome b561
MSTETTYVLGAVVVGLAATLFMDVWALFLRRAFSIPSANYCLVGRWLRHMPQGTFTHASIAAAPQKRYECTVGWIAHYVIGAVYALVLVAFVSGSWLVRPTLLPAMLFGIGSVLAPYLIMQPSFGLGIAASRTPNPPQARMRSLMAHSVFGIGLYVCAVGVSFVLRVHA